MIVVIKKLYICEVNMTTQKTNVMNLELSRVEKVDYKFSYEFALLTGKSELEAHEAAMQKVIKSRKMAEQMKDEVWVNLVTGEKFKTNF